MALAIAMLACHSIPTKDLLNLAGFRDEKDRKGHHLARLAGPGMPASSRVCGSCWPESAVVRAVEHHRNTRVKLSRNTSPIELEDYVGYSEIAIDEPPTKHTLLPGAIPPSTAPEKKAPRMHGPVAESLSDNVLGVHRM